MATIGFTCVASGAGNSSVVVQKLRFLVFVCNGAKNKFYSRVDKDLGFGQDAHPDGLAALCCAAGEERETERPASPAGLALVQAGRMKVKEGQAVWVKDPAIAKDNLYNIGHGAPTHAIARLFVYILPFLFARLPSHSSNAIGSPLHPCAGCHCLCSFALLQ